jgi:hypothetical protein
MNIVKGILNDKLIDNFSTFFTYFIYFYKIVTVFLWNYLVLNRFIGDLIGSVNPCLKGILKKEWCDTCKSSRKNSEHFLKFDAESVNQCQFDALYNVLGNLLIKQKVLKIFFNWEPMSHITFSWLTLPAPGIVYG